MRVSLIYKYKFWVIGCLVSVTAATGITYAIVSKNNSHNSTITESIQTPTYKYSYLSSKCQQGLSNYNLLLSGISTEQKSINDSTQGDITSIKGTEAVNVSEGEKLYNYQKSQYDAAVAAGDTELQNQIFKVMMYYNGQIVDAQNDSKQQQLVVLNSAKTKIEKLSASQKIIQERVEKLSSCVSLVDRQHEFTGVEISDYEALVTQSNTRP